MASRAEGPARLPARLGGAGPVVRPPGPVGPGRTDHNAARSKPRRSDGRASAEGAGAAGPKRVHGGADPAGGLDQPGTASAVAARSTRPRFLAGRKLGQGGTGPARRADPCTLQCQGPAQPGIAAATDEGAGQVESERAYAGAAGWRS